MIPLVEQSDVPAARSRRPRADARRNYELLLKAAAEVFDEAGVDAPLDDIARRAGVGNATLYRHFPTRRDLIIAVYADEVTALCAYAEVVLDEDAPDDALFGWLRAFITHVGAKRELALAIADDRDGRRSTPVDRWHDDVSEIVSTLLTRAQRSAAVRADLDVSDLLALANGIALTSTDPDQVERLLLLVRHGVGSAPSGRTPGYG